MQLWTTGNYHWYLKQSVLFDRPEHRIATVQWDPEHAYRLHIMCSSGQYYQYTWAWATSNSVGRTSDDQALVAVIDGGMAINILTITFSFSLTLFPFHESPSCSPTCAGPETFVRRGSNFNVFFLLLFFLWGREGPNTTVCEPSSARQGNAI